MHGILATMTDRRSNLFMNFFSKYPARVYKKGEMIIRPDDIPSGIFYIEKGYIRIYSITRDGQERLHIIYKNDELFPLMWALQDIQKNLYYEALEDSILRKSSKEDFLQFIKSHNDGLFDVTNRLVVMFSTFSDRIDNLEITKAYPRLIARLLFLATRFGIRKGEKVRLAAPITQRDIAVSIAMTRETTSREFEVLEKKGIIGYKNHRIIINHLKKLKDELEISYEKERL